MSSTDSDSDFRNQQTSAQEDSDGDIIEIESSENDSVHEESCHACDGSGELLCCDTCSNAYHLDCFYPHLPDIPKGVWRCPECSPDTCSICTKSGGEIQCSFCGAFFHLNCLDVVPKPSKRWKCMLCLEEKGIQKIMNWRYQEDTIDDSKEYSLYWRKINDQWHEDYNKNRRVYTSTDHLHCDICNKKKKQNDYLRICTRCGIGIHYDCGQNIDNSLYVDQQGRDFLCRKCRLDTLELQRGFCHICKEEKNDCFNCSSCDSDFCKSCMSSLFLINPFLPSIINNQNPKNNKKNKKSHIPSQSINKQLDLINNQLYKPYKCPICNDICPCEQCQDDRDMDDILCYICGEDQTDDNPILICDRCSMGIHQDCAGLESIPEGEFYCEYCQVYNGQIIKWKHKLCNYCHQQKRKCITCDCGDVLCEDCMKGPLYMYYGYDIQNHIYKCPKCVYSQHNNNFYKEKLDSLFVPVAPLPPLTPDLYIRQKKKNSREYLVKFNDTSFFYSYWCTEKQVEEMNKQKLHNYIKKIESEEFEEEANEEYKALEPERVINKREGEFCTQYYVKWNALPYNECTWEDVGDLTDFPQLIEEFKQRENNKKLRVIENPPIQYSELPEKYPYMNCTLYDYQRKGINWLRYGWWKKQGLILGDEMGLGKTIQSIIYISSLIHIEGIRKPFLIIAPLSTVSNWMNEFREWAPDLYATPFTGNSEARQIILDNDIYNKNGDPFIDVIITTYEIYMADSSRLNKIKYEGIIVDEAHRLKGGKDNPPDLEQLKSYLSPCLLRRLKREVLHLPPKKEIVIPLCLSPLQQEFYKAVLLHNYSYLSSTDRKAPLLNVLMQLRKVCNHPLLIPAGQELFDRLLEENLNDAKDKKKLENAERKSELSKKTEEKKKEILNNNNNKAENNTDTPVSNRDDAASVTVEEDIETKLYNEHRLKLLVNMSGKIHMLDLLLKSLIPAGHKVIIFSQFTTVLDILENYIQLSSYSYCRLDGSTSHSLRKLLIDKYQTGTIDIFLISTKAGGLGVNLTKADSVILFDSDFNPYNDLQAMSRAHRIGQKKTVIIYRLYIKDSVEEKLIFIAQSKLSLEKAIVGDEDTENDLSRDMVQHISLYIYIYIVYYLLYIIYYIFTYYIYIFLIIYVLKAGVKQLFDDNNNDKQVLETLKWGDVDQLMKTKQLEIDARKEEEETKEEENNRGERNFMDQFNETHIEIEKKPDVTFDVEDINWDNILKDRYEEIELKKMMELGRGKRKRRQINYNEGKIDLGLDDEEDETFQATISPSTDSDEDIISNTIPDNIPTEEKPIDLKDEKQRLKRHVITKGRTKKARQIIQKNNPTKAPEADVDFYINSARNESVPNNIFSSYYRCENNKNFSPYWLKETQRTQIIRYIYNNGVDFENGRLDMNMMIKAIETTCNVKNIDVNNIYIYIYMIIFRYMEYEQFKFFVYHEISISLSLSDISSNGSITRDITLYPDYFTELTKKCQMENILHPSLIQSNIFTRLAIGYKKHGLKAYKAIYMDIKLKLGQDPILLDYLYKRNQLQSVNMYMNSMNNIQNSIPQPANQNSLYSTTNNVNPSFIGAQENGSSNRNIQILSPPLPSDYIVNKNININGNNTVDQDLIRNSQDGSHNRGEITLEQPKIDPLNYLNLTVEDVRFYCKEFNHYLLTKPWTLSNNIPETKRIATADLLPQMELFSTVFSTTTLAKQFFLKPRFYNTNDAKTKMNVLNKYIETVEDLLNVGESLIPVEPKSTNEPSS
ncbi:hypothetical protein WA158_005308 [Blastocystis sp. Blastoise]